MAEVVAAGAHEVAGDSLNGITDFPRKGDHLQIMAYRKSKDNLS